MAQTKPKNITSSDARDLASVVVPSTSGNRGAEREHQNRINKNLDGRISGVEDTIANIQVGSGASGGGAHTTIQVDASNLDLTLTGTNDYFIDIATGGVGPNELASTAVTAGDYGDDDQSPTFTVDADGRITLATDVQIPITVYLTTATGGVSAGDIVGINASGEVLPALASSVDTQAIGYVKSSFSVGATAKVYLNKGTLTGLSGLTIGSQYFLSATSAGGVTDSPNFTTGYVVQMVGVALSTTSLSVDISEASEVT